MTSNGSFHIVDALVGLILVATSGIRFGLADIARVAALAVVLSKEPAVPGRRPRRGQDERLGMASNAATQLAPQNSMLEISEAQLTLRLGRHG